MDWDQFDLNPKTIAALKKADIKSVKEILNLSGADLQRLMKLSSADIQCLLKTVSHTLRRNSMLTALQLYQDKDPFTSQHQKLSLGCAVLDSLLKGGIPLVGITELAGESSAGKTQIGLQLCLCVQFPYQYGGLESGAVYICTEDVFPSKRLQQLIDQQHKLRADVPAEIIQKIRFGNNIFVEQAADLDTFQQCLSRLSPLLARGMARLVLIDSMAALFRADFGPAHAALKARYLQAFGAQLHSLSTRFRTPIVCINQVTDAVSESEAAQCSCRAVGSRVTPALGITWSNQLLLRLMARRLWLPPHSPAAAAAPGAGSRRTLSVVFAPHLPPSFCYYTVQLEGVKGIK
ncbi:DNA repair protein XRCC3 isoform X2 [Zonotrichia leucophrys gambelii]|uniref:DNA repair protein XRCC3 isoform X2 n=1 Tax=Zonotrichia leucophrys gambelii TaxID=257770 RepID=UPI003140B1F8